MNEGLPRPHVTFADGINEGNTDMMKMMRGMIIKDQYNDKLMIEHLREDISFLKSEIVNKNTIITNLICYISTNLCNGSKQQLITLADELKYPSNVQEQQQTDDLSNNSPKDSSKCFDLNNSNITRTISSYLFSQSDCQHIEEDEDSSLSESELLCSESVISSTSNENNYDADNDTSSVSYDIQSNSKQRDPEGNNKNLKQYTVISKFSDNIINKINGKPSQKDTLLIASDSMMNQVDGSMLLSNQFNVKVEAISGCTIERMFTEIHPLLQLQPDYVILHVGTVDSEMKSCKQIIDELIELKCYVENILPNTEVIISKLIMRTDDPKANITIKYLNAKLNNSGIRVLDNDNIREEDLGKKGLHLNRYGTAKLVMNIISLMKQL